MTREQIKLELDAIWIAGYERGYWTQEEIARRAELKAMLAVCEE